MDWKKIVKTVAPALGAALGGPMGGIATKFIADKFLGNPEASEAEVEQALIGMTPDQMARLKALDNDFKVQMKKLDIDVFALEVEDKKSAREIFKVNVWPQIILSAIFTLGYFYAVRMLLKALIGGEAILDPSNQSLFVLFSTIFGVLTAAIPQILGFWFGTTKSSNEKTALLADSKK